MKRKSCIFLDRDGVLNRERGDYTYKLEHFEILDGVKEAIELAKENGFLLIVITNQGGIAKGLYTLNDVMLCHDFLQSETNYLIDDIYVATMHPSVSESLLRKPDSLMFEKAMAKYNIDPQTSWMIGDSERDLIAAAKVGISGYFVRTRKDFPAAKKRASSLLEAVKNIIGAK